MHNQWLSECRAWAVRRAIEDAVGPLADEVIDVTGGASKEATAGPWRGGGGLAEPNPTGDQVALAQFERNHRDQVRQWPLWRKVEIDLQGCFYAEVFASEMNGAQGAG